MKLAQSSWMSLARHFLLRCANPNYANVSLWLINFALKNKGYLCTKQHALFSQLISKSSASHKKLGVIHFKNPSLTNKYTSCRLDFRYTCICLYYQPHLYVYIVYICLLWKSHFQTTLLISRCQGSNILNSLTHGNIFCSIQYQRKHYFLRLI